MAEEGIKVCRKCLTEKPLSEFQKKADRKDGLHDWCRPCDNAYQRHYYYEKEKMRRLRAKWGDL